MKNTKIFSKYLFLILSGIAPTLIYYFRSNWNQQGLNYPLDYFGDILVYGNLINNGNLGNPLVGANLGAPSTQKLYLSAYGAEWFQAFLISLLPRGEDGPWLQFNLYFFLSFFLVGVCSFVAFRWIGISAKVSFVLSISFSLYPSHYASYSSVFLANFAGLPLIVALAYRIISDRQISPENLRSRLRKYVGKYSGVFGDSLIILIIMLVNCTTGNYYMWFSAQLLLLLSGIYAFFNFRGHKWRKLLTVSIVQFFFIGVLLLPIIFSKLVNGMGISENATSDRRSFAAYANGGDPFSLFLPLRNSLVETFARYIPGMDQFLTEYYSSPVTLGTTYVFFQSGLVFLIATALLFLLSRNILSSKSLGAKKLARNLNLCSENDLFNLFVIFGATIFLFSRGGFGTLFSFAFPFIRVYSRAAFFCYFTALAIVGMYFQKKITRNSPHGMTNSLISSLIFTFVLLEPISAIPKVASLDLNAPITRTIQALERNSAGLEGSIGLNFKSLSINGNKALVEKAEEYLPEKCIVAIFPLTQYPVDFNIGVTSYYAYETLKPALSNSTLRWTSGQIVNEKLNPSFSRAYDEYLKRRVETTIEALGGPQVCGVVVFKSLVEVIDKSTQGFKFDIFPSNLEIEAALDIARFESCYADVSAEVELFCRRES